MQSANFSKISNLDYLHKLCNGNKTFVNEMIGIFLKDCPIDIDLFEKNIKRKDLEAIRYSAHKLKSTLPYIGLKIAEKDISEIERLAVHPSAIPQIKIHFEKIKGICLRAIEELKPGQ